MSRRGTLKAALTLCGHVLVVGALTLAAASPAFAAKPVGAGHGGGNGGGGGGGGGGVPGSTTTGFDVSYPQCGTSLPTPIAFGIVGVDDGLANDLNPCLGPSSAYPSYTQSELYWAVATAVGGTSQPDASLYVNTADPGNLYNGSPIADWPTSSSAADPYGACTTTTIRSRGHDYTVGQDSQACAWQYGDDKATADAAWLTGAANAIDGQSPPLTVSSSPSNYPWWLDVETGNTWQSDLGMNVADLQGMVAGLQAAGVTTVGVYSTSSQWGSITGGTSSSSGSLYGLPDWIPGATSLTGAQANCGLPSFTEGSVTVTQWTGTVDNDLAC
ncbi:MAG: hypothetical protein M0007_13215 [Actinomycetota bacterium]|jgi:hypothetical protein|nr:hypothetical protein [Actinomycetota bacterium]